MYYCEDTRITAVAVHRIGSQLDPEGGIAISPQLLDFEKEMEPVLLDFFLQSLKHEAYYHFYAENGLENNSSYHFVSSVLDSDALLYPQSVLLAKSLYQNCADEGINKGEFYVVKFQNCCYDGQLVDAVGLFKSEKKETFLTVSDDDLNIRLQAQNGVNISKIEKACLVFNVERANGYVVVAQDSAKSGVNAFYWIDAFLGLRQLEDEFFQTQQLLTMCNVFVKEKLPEQYNVTKDGQADLINRSLGFFKENEVFEIEDFEKEVIEQPELIEDFRDFKKDYQKAKGFEFSDSFEISETAVKKQARVMKSVIRLDKNFHIYVHGKREFIKRGVDQGLGLQYYQLFFNQEE